MIAKLKFEVSSLFGVTRIDRINKQSSKNRKHLRYTYYDNMQKKMLDFAYHWSGYNFIQNTWNC